MRNNLIIIGNLKKKNCAYFYLILNTFSGKLAGILFVCPFRGLLVSQTKSTK